MDLRKRLTSAATVVLAGILMFPAACGGERHTLVYVPRVEAECEKAGNIAHWRCEDCGETFLDDEGRMPAAEVVIGPLGHNFSETLVLPGCEKAGSVSQRCSRCDKENFEILPAIGHNYGSFRTTKAPGCFTEGEESRVCANCGDVERNPLPAIGHHVWDFNNICTLCRYECHPSEGLTYSLIAEDGKEIGYCVDGSGTAGEIAVLPYYHLKLPVVALEANAFCDREDLREVILYAPLTRIGERAFFGCNSLNSVKFSEEGHVKIEERAFEGCNLLQEIELKDGELSSYAFYGCSMLESVKFGANVTKISADAFINCGRLVTIEVDEGNARYSGEGNCLTERETGVLLRGGNASKIPAWAIEIGDLAFNLCEQLQSITIPKSVQKIGDFAFRDCSGLKEIVYEGTREEWDRIEKGKQWSTYTDPGLTIRCLED